MKRQGRQHGMVRTYPILSTPWDPRPKPRNLNVLGSPPTAGLFTKVSSKPTNHSKFTGKCGRPKCSDCHIHPAGKSRDKVKGSQKMRSSLDVVSSYGLITWRVVDAAHGFKIPGFSATGVLDYLVSDDYVDYYGYETECSDGYDDESYDYQMKSYGVKIEEVVDDDDEWMSLIGKQLKEMKAGVWWKKCDLLY